MICDRCGQPLAVTPAGRLRPCCCLGLVGPVSGRTPSGRRTVPALDGRERAAGAHLEPGAAGERP